MATGWELTYYVGTWNGHTGMITWPWTCVQYLLLNRIRIRQGWPPISVSCGDPKKKNKSNLQNVIIKRRNDYLELSVSSRSIICPPAIRKVISILFRRTRTQHFDFADIRRALKNNLLWLGSALPVASVKSTQMNGREISKWISRQKQG